MIALDTNVLVRFLTRDDPEQTSLVDALIGTLDADNVAFVSRDVMQKLVWVLRKGYGFRREEIARALQSLMEAEEFEIENETTVHQALDAYAQSGPGFAADFTFGELLQGTRIEADDLHDCDAYARGFHRGPATTNAARAADHALLYRHAGQSPSPPDADV